MLSGVTYSFFFSASSTSLPRSATFLIRAAARMLASGLLNVTLLTMDLGKHIGQSTRSGGDEQFRLNICQGKLGPSGEGS